jgi:hypothetical protein
MKTTIERRNEWDANFDFWLTSMDFVMRWEKKEGGEKPHRNRIH